MWKPRWNCIAIRVRYVWWKNWDCKRLSRIMLGLPCHVWFLQCCMLIHVHLQPMFRGLVTDTVAEKTTWSFTLKRECTLVQCWGEYLELWGWNEQETGENYVMKSFMIYRMTKNFTTNHHKMNLHYSTRNKIL